MLRATPAVSLIIVLAGLDTGAVAWGQKGAAERLERLPKGWTVVKHLAVPAQQLPAFTPKLGAPVIRLSNTTLVVDGQQIKINIIEGKTEADAAKIHQAIRLVHKDRPWACCIEGTTVVEFVGSTRMIERAYQELGFTPTQLSYTVSFRAAPFEQCDYMQWNKLFNAFLSPNPDAALIAKLAKSFTFGEEIRLRTHGLGQNKTAFTFTPAPRDSRPVAGGEITSCSFANLPIQFGVPRVGITATVASTAFALTPSQRQAGKELLSATAFWPSDDAEIVKLAKQITEGKTTVRDRTDAILDWLAPGKTIKYAGQVTGSRYGVKQVLKQGYGHCWDFSDCFVTLSRAAGVPSRQVLGWLHGDSGHVWAEVLIEGKGWRQVDPTGGGGCDSRYIPYIASEDGRMSFAYVSAVDIKLKS